MLRWWRALDANHKTLTQTVAVVVVMASLGWLAVPAYNWFCRVTGYGGTTQVAEAGSDLILDQTIQIRFDAGLEPGMEWEFRPVERTMTLRIGETGIAYYEAYNPTDRPIAGTAAYNVAPFSAGSYFNKIACFCFTEQILQPGQRVLMPVTFFVDPEIVTDPEANFYSTITLSYTFYESELPGDLAARSTEVTQVTN